MRDRAGGTCLDWLIRSLQFQLRRADVRCLSEVLIVLSLGGQLGGMDFSRGDGKAYGGVNIADPIPAGPPRG